MADKDMDIFSLNKVYPDVYDLLKYKIKSLEDIKDDSIIVFDTNALLVPYSTGNDTLEEIKTILTKIVEEEKIYLPAQVLREFIKNRPNKLCEIYQKISDDKSKDPSTQLNYIPLLSSIDEYHQIREIEKEIKNLKEKRKKLIDDVLFNIESWKYLDDPVSKLYDQLFSEEIIIEPECKPEDIVKDFNYRKTNNIPPGYKDFSKKENPAGDLIIWHTILKLGKEFKKHVIFVCNDNKSDWWHQSNNKHFIPRFELIDEFRRASEGNTIHIITFSQFMKLFDANEEMVEELRQEELLNSWKSNKIITTVFVGKKEYILNGQKFIGEVEPYFDGKRVFVEARVLSEAFGSELNFDSATQVVTLENSRITVTFTIGSNVITNSKGETVISDVAPILENGYIFVPFRAIAEAFKASVEAVFKNDGNIKNITFEYELNV